MAMQINLQEYAQFVGHLLPKRTQNIVAVVPPQPPVGYQILSMPQALSGDQEGWWITFALNLQMDILGMLTYDAEGQLISFFTAQEAILALFAMLDNLMDLAADCTPSFSDDHMAELYAIWQAWQQVQMPDSGNRICLYCWKEANPGQPFPSQESSSCCARHKHLLQRGGSQA